MEKETFNKMNNNFKTILKNFCNIAFIQLAGNVVIILAVFIDLVIVGIFLDSTSLDALGFVIPLILLFYACSFSLSTGIQSTVSWFLGKSNKMKANESFNIGFIFSLAFSVILSLLVILFNEQVALALGTQPDMQSYYLTKQIIIILACGAPVLMIGQILLLIIKMDNRKFLPYIAALCLILGNIIFVLTNIFIFNLGLIGVVLAIDFGIVLCVIVLCIHFFNKNITFSLNFKFTKKSLLLLKKIILNAWPNIVAQISNALAIWTTNLLVANFGSEIYVGAHTIISSVGTILCVVSTSFGTSTLILGNKYYSYNDKTNIKNLFKCFIFMCVVFYFIISVCGFVFSNNLCELIVDTNSREFTIACTGVKMYSISLILSSINVSLRNFVQSLQFFKQAQLACFFNNFVFTFIFAFILVCCLNVDMIWWMYALNQIASLIFILGIFIPKYKKLLNNWSFKKLSYK